VANNLAVIDGTGASQSLQATNVGGVLLMNNKLNDGVNDVKTASAANLSGNLGINAAMVAPPGQWAVTNAPAVNTQATISKAAGAAGVYHVCTGLTCTLANDATGSAQANLIFNLRNGATGAGTILASFALSVPATAGACQVLPLTGLNIPGSAATAMTLECASAPGTHTAASVALFGYDTQ
jgi:hypothetical protein